jgi:uncharacterized protein (DUF2147 family)
MQTFWFVALGLIALSNPALAEDAHGTWLVKDKTAVVKVDTCEQGLCGTIGWSQTPGTDKNNPDPTLKNRDVIGMPIFTMKPAGPNKWEGEIYNAENGKTYSGSVTLKGPNTLQIEGCVARILCGSQAWTRTTCDQSGPGAAKQVKRLPADKSGPKTTGSTATAAVQPLTGCRGVAQ